MENRVVEYESLEAIATITLNRPAAPERLDLVA